VLSTREQAIENFGQYFEQYKLPRTLGRVYGLLLVTGDPYVGLDQLSAELAVSKASVSTVVRQLLLFNMIEKVTRPGDRRDYYRISPQAHRAYLQSSIQGALSFAALVEFAGSIEGLAPEAKQRILDIEKLYEALGKLMKDFFESYPQE
jgi:DNA-binding MarR family transcriptional regulator